MNPDIGGHMTQKKENAEKFLGKRKDRDTVESQKGDSWEDFVEDFKINWNVSEELDYNFNHEIQVS